MPVTTRRYHIQKIVSYLKKKQESEEKAMGGNTQSTRPSKINVPDFVSNVKKK
jgi:hypothetical protein